MDASHFALTITMLTLGIGVGFTASSILTNIHTEKLYRALQKSIDKMIECDKRNDQLQQELNILKKQNEMLNETVDKFVKSVFDIKNLPPPDSRLERCVGCCSETQSEIEVPETPTSEQDSTD